MKIVEIRSQAGPNIYSYRPVLVMKLELEGLAERESKEFAGFNERLLKLLPGLHAHHCALGEPGGFVKRLNEGTYFGHIVEHVALEMTTLVGVPVRHGKTRETDVPGTYRVIIEYTAEQGTRFLLRAAVELVEALLRGEEFPLDEKLKEAQRVIARTELGPSTSAILQAATRRGIPWRRLSDGSLVQLGYGKNRKLIQAAMTEQTSAIAVDIASDKELTKTLLSEAGIPVPRGVVVETEAEAVAALQEFDGPVALKPYNGNQGKGVSLNLTTPAQVEQAFRIAQQYAGRVVVEEMLSGRDYRILIVNGKLVAASERVPAHVVGDGTHTIAELIEIINQDPARGDGHGKSLTRLVIDPVMMAYLHKCGHTINDRPRAGERIFLRECANLSTGGTAKDVTAQVHPEIAAMCERATRIIGLDICGIDLILHDVAEPLKPGGGIVEVNAAPGLRMHLAPSEGESRQVGDAIIEMLYPAPTDGRIPIISITGTNGKTTITRMIGHVLGTAGWNVGMTTTDGIYLNGQRVVKGDTTGPQSARTVLGDPSVEIAVLETARGGIMRAGLGYDWSDISVISNIQPDHIGQDGIKSVDDILFVKSLVAERVREGGTLILNADDQRLARLMDEPRVNEIEKRVVFFSQHPLHVTLRRHLDAEGTAFLLRDGWIVEAQGHTEKRIIKADQIPVTFNGAATFQLTNALAAVAACRAHGLLPEVIAAALKEFRSDLHNPGRAALYKVGAGYVLVDYGHNPDAFEAVCRMAATWYGRRVTGIVGVPGDRDDSVIEQAGRAAARGFERLLVREDRDLRGRRSGEVAELLCRAVKNEVPYRECHVVTDEAEALRKALSEMTPGEVVVLFYEKFDPVMEVLREYDAAPAGDLAELSSTLKVIRQPPAQRRATNSRMA
jgi:cyanophycin synthetase